MQNRDSRIVSLFFTADSNTYTRSPIRLPFSLTHTYPFIGCLREKAPKTGMCVTNFGMKPNKEKSLQSLTQIHTHIPLEPYCKIVKLRSTKLKLE